MRILKHVFEANIKWAKEIKTRDPGFFQQLSKRQNPEILWIGCADSRVPATEISGRLPGDMFVHRNIANLVIHTDLNCLSVIQYAVEELKVKHIVVCGHYGCGGVKAALEQREHGLIDNWLRHVKDVYRFHNDELKQLNNPEDQQNRLSELNVIEQVKNVCHTTIVQRAWKQGRELAIHGWMFSIRNGLLKDMNVTVTNQDEVMMIHQIR